MLLVAAPSLLLRLHKSHWLYYLRAIRLNLIFRLKPQLGVERHPRLQINPHVCSTATDPLWLLLHLTNTSLLLNLLSDPLIIVVLI